MKLVASPLQAGEKLWTGRVVIHKTVHPPFSIGLIDGAQRALSTPLSQVDMVDFFQETKKPGHSRVGIILVLLADTEARKYPAQEVVGTEGARDFP